MTRRSAFTLVELMATIVVIAIVMPVTMRGISMATQITHRAKRQIEAGCLAKSKLSEIVASKQWDGAHSGNFGTEWPDYQWIAELTSSPIPSVYQLDLRVWWRPSSKPHDESVTLSTLVYEGGE